MAADPDRARLWQEYSWMTEGTFGAFYQGWRGLQKLKEAGIVDDATDRKLMKLVDPHDKEKSNVTGFYREVQSLSVGTEVYMREYGKPRDPDSPRPPRPERIPDPKRQEMREQMSWMSDGTFQVYWKSVQALMRLVKARLISYQQAEEIRLNIPKMPSGRPNVTEFERRVKIVEQRVEAKYGNQNSADSPSLRASGPQITDSQRLIVRAPAVNGRKLVPVAVDGRKVKLAWVAE